MDCFPLGGLVAKIVGFGDSFVFGSEIADNHDGRLGWPGQAADLLGFDYETLAVPGCGNDMIAQQIYHYFSSPQHSDTLAVINWTWTMRWDFYLAKDETWITLGPTCVPEKLQHLVDQTQSQRLVDFYRDYANSSLLWNKFRNLQTMVAVQRFLENHGIKSVQTYMDHHLFNTEYHAPDYVRSLQNSVESCMLTWDGMNFIEWCQKRGHEITQTGWHPLLSAHRDAAEYWKDRYAQALA